jgi:hypothetical protein
LDQNGVPVRLVEGLNDPLGSPSCNPLSALYDGPTFGASSVIDGRDMIAKIYVLNGTYDVTTLQWDYRSSGTTSQYQDFEIQGTTVLASANLNDLGGGDHCTSQVITHNVVVSDGVLRVGARYRANNGGKSANGGNAALSGIRIVRIR